jgi:4,5-dihydroxyphthalate decarboxylase
MMAAGRIDAAFTGNAGIGREGAPTPGWEAKQRPAATYAELLPDASRLEAEWYRRSGVYPFHSIVVVKDEILKAHPWIATSLYAAFSEAKAQWLPALRSGQANSSADNDNRNLIPLIGDDPLPYGIAPNLKSIEALIAYTVQQGLMPRRLSIEELFVDPGLS